jgi:glutathione S-transferase
MLTLYTSTGSCSRASHIALEESGLPHEIHLIDFAKSDQRQPDYLAINPKGRVPALATDQGVLTESPAILAHIAALAPEGLLAPIDPFAFARMQAFNLYLATTIHVAHAHGRRASRWSDDAAAQATMAAKVTQNMRDGFALIEADLTGDWVNRRRGHRRVPQGPGPFRTDPGPPRRPAGSSRQGLARGVGYHRLCLFCAGR